MAKPKPIRIEVTEADDGSRRVVCEYADGTITDEPVATGAKPLRKPRKPPGRVTFDRTRKKRF